MATINDWLDYAVIRNVIIRVKLLSREWYQLLSREAFNPNYALFIEADDGTQKPNSDSSINPDHLDMFRFIGQVFGKAVFDGRSTWSK